MNTARCQGCGAPLTQTLVDLGLSPLANSYLPATWAGDDEPVYPLHARVCNTCWLVQVDSVVHPADIFSNYAYFSSYSTTFLEHSERYVDEMIRRFKLDSDSSVVEIASNDGYLLQYFISRGIPSLGIEPAANVAEVARSKGVPTVSSFFGTALAKGLTGQGQQPDLILANNVLAHVPDINDFVAGVSLMLRDNAVYTVEFPHLLNMINEVQFDTIYHEHFTYLSLLAVETIFARHGLKVFDAEEIPTHGGSLRIFACLRSARHQESQRLDGLRRREREAKLDAPSGYEGYDARVRNVKTELVNFLQRLKRDGARVAAYGAAAKGNTLLNYCQVGTDLIPFVVDRNPAKQGMLLPGSHIPVNGVEALRDNALDYLIILPWNIRDEIVHQLADLKRSGCVFVTAIPELRLE